jgi:hypothetical protein
LLGASIYSIIYFGDSTPANPKQSSHLSDTDPQIHDLKLWIDRMRQEGLSDEQITRILGLKINESFDS